MDTKTKACGLTEKEITTLIAALMSQTLNTPQSEVILDSVMERLNYLHKRLKSFSEIEPAKPEAKTEAPKGWGS